ncbi:MAG TPA: hypothetical protein VEX18_07755, partial [Polyangiaceae bacterium]|nr:hypothetical protein [Polyangiaceae bacterium]
DVGRTMRRWFVRGVPGTLVLAACGGTPATAPPFSAPTAARQVASSSPSEPLVPEPRPVPPDPARCGTPVDPPSESWSALEGCRVTFKNAEVEAWLECNMMACGPEKPCCNRCFEGTVGLRIDRREVAVTRRGQWLPCAAGRNCETDRVCALPRGPAFVTGVLSREDSENATAAGRSTNIWLLELEHFEHRVGSCSLREGEVRASELSPGDFCESTFACDDGKHVQVECDGENDGTHTSMCACKIDGRAVPLGKLIAGEGPTSCDNALVKCLAATPGRRRP